MCAIWFFMVVLVLELGNLPTILVMCVQWLFKFVLVLEHGKPANFTYGKCALWFFMVVLVLESGKSANRPWNVFPVVLYGCVGSRTPKPANHP
jgi:hypothetical protein